MNKVFSLFMSLMLMAALMAGSMIPSLAQFASFTQTSSGDPFTLTGSSFDATGVGVDFTFLGPNTAGTNSPIAGVLTLTSEVNGVATPVTVGSNVFDDESLQNIDLSITSDSPINGHSNLLSITNATGTLSGQDGTTTLTLDSQDVNYSSNFVTLLPSSFNSAALSFSTASADVGISSDQLNSLDAGGASGSFRGVDITIKSSVPEPSGLITIGVLGAGMLPLFILAGRRRIHHGASRTPSRSSD